MAQTASDEQVRGFVDPGEEDARGIGIRGGGFRGLVAFEEADLEELSRCASEAEEDVDGVLLVLENPTPNEIPMILSADGLVTSKGGSTSHAAVAIHGIEDKPYAAVLSVAGITVNTRRGEMVFTSEDGNPIHHVRKGDVLSIHGESGAVYVGSRKLHPGVEPEAVNIA
jgi:pyruvate,orthophosphate dikinase